MTTWLLLIMLNGHVWLSVPAIPTEQGCVTLLNEISEDVPMRFHRFYSFKCHRVE